MIDEHFLYLIAGLSFASYALLSARARRIPNALFWGLLATTFLCGNAIGDVATGVLVLGMIAIGGFGWMRGPTHADAEASASARLRSAERHGNRLFLPMLIVPAGALLGTLLFKRFPSLVAPSQTTLVALATSVLLALLVTMFWLRPGPSAPFRAGLRMMDAVGWAAILPQTLACLGAILDRAGTGKAVGVLVAQVLPQNSLPAAVIAYGVGMAACTVVMGNAFAAFPILMGAIGFPHLIDHFHGKAPVIGAIGMLTGFCGTLLTPMAANYTLVPAALLELKDKYGVIRAQATTGVLLLIANVTLLYVLAF